MMDDFAVDLDKVLDDFEEREDQVLETTQDVSRIENTIESLNHLNSRVSNGGASFTDSNSSGIMYGQDSRMSSLDFSFKQNCIGNSNQLYQPSDNLDLSEADFAPALHKNAAKDSDVINEMSQENQLYANGVVTDSPATKCNETEQGRNTSAEENDKDRMTTESYCDAGTTNSISNENCTPPTTNDEILNGVYSQDKDCLVENIDKNKAPATVQRPDLIPVDVKPILDVNLAQCHAVNSNSTALSMPAGNISSLELYHTELPVERGEMISDVSTHITDHNDYLKDEGVDGSLLDDTNMVPPEISTSADRETSQNHTSPDVTVFTGTVKSEDGNVSAVSVPNNKAIDPVVVGFPQCGEDDISDTEMDSYLSDMSHSGSTIERTKETNEQSCTGKNINKHNFSLGIAKLTADDTNVGILSSTEETSVGGSSTVAMTLNLPSVSGNIYSRLPDIPQPSHNEICKSPVATISDSSRLSSPWNDSGKETDSSLVDKFLSSSVMSPGVATPLEDPGFTRVPGYEPGQLSPHAEVTTPLEDDDSEQSIVCDTSMDLGSVTPIDAVENEFSAGESNIYEISKSSNNSTTFPNYIDSPQRMLVNQKRDSVHTDIADASLLQVAVSGIPCSDQNDTKNRSDSVAVNELSKPCNFASDMNVSSPMGVGARPKDPTQMRKARPNSLLGLSKPDLRPAVPIVPTGETCDSGLGESVENPSVPGLIPMESPMSQPVIGNTHDIINMQLAQNKMSPLRKTQTNLEIKQQLDNKNADNMPNDLALDQVNNSHDLSSNTSHTFIAKSGTANQDGNALYTSRNQLASGIHIPSPTTDMSQGSVNLSNLNPLYQGDLPVYQEQAAQMMEHSVEPQKANHPEVSQEIGDSTVIANRENVDDGSDRLKQKRPTSLNLPVRHDFQPQAEDDDDSVIEDMGYGSSASSEAPTPFNEMSEGDGYVGIPSGVPPALGAMSPPLASANINMTITQLGKVAPHWLPDAEAPNCMQCEARFTFTKRRHHCRACGKIFCSACCSLKCKLQYMEKENRVCSKCYQDIVRAQAYEKLHSPTPSPNPNNPSEYCSTIPPLQQAQSSINAPPPTVMVPIGVLRKEGSQKVKEPKQVMFSDGIRPGGDLTDLDGSSEIRVSSRKSGRSSKKVERTAQQQKSPAKTKVVKMHEPNRNVCLIPENGLPPVMLSTGVKGDFSIEENADIEQVLSKIRSTEDPSPVVFAVNKNLFVLVKILNLDCCVNRVCWCFTTRGMCTVGQEEIVIVLECVPDEKTVPRDIFTHLHAVYEEAGNGNTVSNLGHTIFGPTFGQSFLGSKDHCGFLYIQPTFQCLQKLILPPAPYVFGLLLQQWETPWAKVFPIRLMLRLGAEYRYYPCPLISVRYRKPVYGEIGHTIMNLLADFRNFQYMLPQIRGVVIYMENKQTHILFPRNRYDDVMKVLNNSNDHVMALGANFSMTADSHLVCIQNDDGNYQTQAINIQNKPRKITGASFVVFSGALKTGSGLQGKSSIVEDGLMVQMLPDSMMVLKQAMRDMEDYTVNCGSVDSAVVEEQVLIKWTDDDKNVNIGVRSPIDNKTMDGVESIHIHNATDYVGERRTIRWTTVFFLEASELGSGSGEPVDLSRLAETLASACCVALVPQLDKLKEASLTKIGLRVSIQAETVGYEIGAGGERLPNFYMNELDNKLIPVIHNAALHSHNSPVVLELVFHIIE